MSATPTSSKGGYLGGRDLLLVILVILLIFQNPPATPTETASIDSPGNMAVSIAWPEGSYDVDLWVRAPGEEKAVGYSNRGGKVFNLLRDDLGTSGDDGPFNREDAFSRGLPAGEYVVNLHGYTLAQEVDVVVEVRVMVGGESVLLVREEMTIRPKQERTVARFKLDGDGKMVPGSLNRVFEPLRSAGK